MKLDIAGKVIVISGGTSGVGLEMAEKCAAEGANVVFGGRNEKMANTVIEATKDFPGKTCFIKTDVSDTLNCKKLFDETMRMFGKVNGFINYAGITPVSPLDTCSVDLFDQVMNVNFRAAFFCCQYAIQCMRQSGGGSIVLMGSPHAWGGEKDRAAYACSKGAMVTLMQHIAKNYAEEQIRCNYLTMGWTLTEGEIALRTALEEDVDKYFEEAAKQIPMGRLCVPTDYTEEIIYLLSDASSMMTGSVLQMGGGFFI